ncbi:MAG: hypothetical protein JW986_05750 [Methanotrichaceae archaeon]|nr:hypothetical protein [Methanotrichaceae archaeon]
MNIIPSSARVKVGGQIVATTADTFLISGCTFMVGPKAQPCIQIQWLVPASRVKIGGQPVVLQCSTGICQSAEQALQGPPNVLVTQTRVRGQ